MHLFNDILPELALKVGQEAGICRNNCEGAQRLLQRLCMALTDGARQLDDLLHARHALHDVLISCLHAKHTCLTGEPHPRAPGFSTGTSF